MSTLTQLEALRMKCSEAQARLDAMPGARTDDYVEIADDVSESAELFCIAALATNFGELDAEMERLREHERTVQSLAAMLGWGNPPPRETLELQINGLKAMARPATDKEPTP